MKVVPRPGAALDVQAARRGRARSRARRRGRGRCRSAWSCRTGVQILRQHVGIDARRRCRRTVTSTSPSARAQPSVHLARAVVGARLHRVVREVDERAPQLALVAGDARGRGLRAASGRARCAAARRRRRCRAPRPSRSATLHAPSSGLGRRAYSRKSLTMILRWPSSRSMRCTCASFSVVAGEIVAQQARVQLDAAERVAHLVRDAGQHHLHALVARAQLLAHLLHRVGDEADLVVGLAAHGAVEIAAAHALGGARQPADGPREQARDQDRERDDRERAARRRRRTACGGSARARRRTTRRRRRRRRTRSRRCRRAAARSPTCRGWPSRPRNSTDAVGVPEKTRRSSDCQRVERVVALADGHAAARVGARGAVLGEDVDARGAGLAGELAEAPLQVAIGARALVAGAASSATFSSPICAAAAAATEVSRRPSSSSSARRAM